jgi:LacI family fructose operon transcriptional repressor
LVAADAAATCRHRKIGVWNQTADDIGFSNASLRGPRVPKTVAEIARETGLSVTTVRLIANGQAGKYRISEATAKIVEEQIQRYGVAVNHAARSLKLRRTDTIGLVVPELSNAFFARLMSGLEELCRGSGLVLLTASTNENPDLEERAVRSLYARGVDGLIVAPCRTPDYGRLFAKTARMPIVVVDRAFPNSRYPSVVSDNAAAGFALTRAVLATGAPLTAFLCGQTELPTIAGRIRGFAAACQEAGISNWEALILRAAENSVGAGRTLMAQALERGRPPASFMCSSLMVLEGATQRLKEQIGLIPPETVMGTFDDQESLDFLPNQVFSARQNEAELASRAFARLEELRSGTMTEFEQSTVPFQLIRRGGVHSALRAEASLRR